MCYLLILSQLCTYPFLLKSGLLGLGCYVPQASLTAASPSGSACGRHWWRREGRRKRNFCLWHQLHGRDRQLLVVSEGERAMIVNSPEACPCRLSSPGCSSASLAVPVPVMVVLALAAVAGGATRWAPPQGTLAASGFPDRPTSFFSNSANTCTVQVKCMVWFLFFWLDSDGHIYEQSTSTLKYQYIDFEL